MFIRDTFGSIAIVNVFLKGLEADAVFASKPQEGYATACYKLKINHCIHVFLCNKHQNYS